MNKHYNGCLLLQLLIDGLVDAKVDSNTNATGESGERLPTRPHDNETGQRSIPASKQTANVVLPKEEAKKGASSNVNSHGAHSHHMV